MRRSRINTGEKRWWPGRELNPRRQPFQGCALPPELPGHVSKPALRGGLRGLFASGPLLAGWMQRVDAGSVRNVFDYSNARGFPQRVLRFGLRLYGKSLTTEARRKPSKFVKGLKALLARDFLRILGFSTSPRLCGELIS